MRYPDFNEMSRRQINAFFRLKDESDKYPIWGRFNATERAIRQVQRDERRRRRRREYRAEGLEYALALEDRITAIVNDPRL